MHDQALPPRRRGSLFGAGPACDRVSLRQSDLERFNVDARLSCPAGPRILHRGAAGAYGPDLQPASAHAAACVHLAQLRVGGTAASAACSLPGAPLAQHRNRKPLYISNSRKRVAMRSDRVRSQMTPAIAPHSQGRNVHYSGPTLVFVRGTATGWVYRFSPAEPVQPVDARDVPALLASPLFRVAR
jgi:hypothetical protein